MDVNYLPGTYVKGDDRKVANTRRRAVALVFEGYTLEAAVPAEDASYRDLQEQAKDAGIPANQSADDLREQIAVETLPSPTTVVDPTA